MEGTTLGKYELRTIIGHGAVGTVYEGWDPILARKVAVKTLPLLGVDEEGREKQARFLREARAAASLYHPNIVAVYDYGETDSLAYIVMELISGRPLDALLEHGARLPPGEVAAIMDGLLAGLQHSHERGVVHRDIKPANVVLSNAGAVKITDFGIAHLESSDMTRVGSVIGTPAYMAPEQVLGEAVDARTDIYAAGVVLYQMLLGRRPFEGGTASIMHKIVNAQPNLQGDLLDGALPGIAAVLGKALAKSPEDRYASARELAWALRVEFGRAGALPLGYADDATVVAAPGTLPGAYRTGTGTGSRTGTATGALAPIPAPQQIQETGSPQSPGARRKLPPAILALIGVLLLGGFGWWTLNTPGVPPKSAPTQTQLPIPGSPPLPEAPGQGTPATATKDAASLEAPAPKIAMPEVAPPTADVQPTVSPAFVPTPPDGRGGATAALLAALNQAAATLPCSLMLAEAGRGGIAVNGVTALGDASGMEIQAVLRRIAAQAVNAPQVAWNIRRADGPYCGVLDALRSARDGASSPALLLSLAGPGGAAMEGAPIEVGIASPTGMSVLLDFYAPDRSVTHLASAMAGNGRITVPAPRGIGLITLTASPAPLIAPGRPAHEPAAFYLEDLRTSLARSRGQGVQIVVDALIVEGRPH